jgi:quinol monooxygenase YgiN
MFVTVTVKPERLDDFLAAMKTDAEGSRKEAGCLRFDLLKSDQENVYHFYEAYTDAAAVTAHKETSHCTSRACIRSITTLRAWLLSTHRHTATSSSALNGSCRFSLLRACALCAFASTSPPSDRCVAGRQRVGRLQEERWHHRRQPSCRKGDRSGLPAIN